MLKLLNKEEDKVNVQDYIVAYIDILGTKDKIKNDDDAQYLNTIKSMYQTAKLFYKTELFKNAEWFPELHYKIFSDNIIVATKIPEKRYLIRDVISRVLGFVSVYQAMALYNEIITRGAVTTGELYIDDLFIYGKALVEAVYLEENVAFYPRVILSDSIKQNYKIENNDTVVIDMDNQAFVNYYSNLTGKIGNRITNEEISVIKDFIVKEHHKYMDNIKIQQKIDWLVQYHNSYVSKLIGTWDITEEHLITPVNVINEKILVRKNSMPRDIKTEEMI